jgi:uncharacterized protein (DUF1810 family)
MTSESLQRFVAAQDPVYAQVCAELSSGKKTSHWMWFIFPQLRALGRSATALHFGLASRAEAALYWQHPVLGHRLKECTELVLALEAKSAYEIFGTPDDLKFRSCMTLFAHCAEGERLFSEALSRYYAGEQDDRTLALLSDDAGVGAGPRRF